ncbi:MAG: DUF2889 domain-containing protein [Novosphingobium sp.]|nr:DUF2889 domain-containing protein [Novosphingobium sp.]
MPSTVDAKDRAGYRRRIRIEPTEHAVIAMLEDDIHCLAVILRHDGERVIKVEPTIERLPWDTCPGAAAKLVETFEGQLLSEVTARRDKKQNCTHMHDMAVLAAAHAHDHAGFTYEIFASDPVEDERILEIRRDGKSLHRWIERGAVLAEPPELAGKPLFALRDWIGSLEGAEQEAARVLQWGALVAHGRTMSMEDQSRAAEMPPNCYTFQPERAARAQRIGERFDFSQGSRVPLAGIDDTMLAQLRRD